MKCSCFASTTTAYLICKCLTEEVNIFINFRFTEKSQKQMQFREKNFSLVIQFWALLGWWRGRDGNANKNIQAQTQRRIQWMTKNIWNDNLFSGYKISVHFGWKVLKCNRSESPIQPNQLVQHRYWAIICKFVFRLHWFTFSVEWRLVGIFFFASFCSDKMQAECLEVRVKCDMYKMLEGTVNF